MTYQSEQLEREAEEARLELAGTLDELRYRVSPGHVVDQLSDYVREGPAAEFVHNLMREIRENPLPLLLIAVGVAWLVTSSALSSRAQNRRIEFGTQPSKDEIDPVATASVATASEPSRRSAAVEICELVPLDA